MPFFGLSKQKKEEAVEVRFLPLKLGSVTSFVHEHPKRFVFVLGACTKKVFSVFYF